MVGYVQHNHPHTTLNDPWALALGHPPTPAGTYTPGRELTYSKGGWEASFEKGLWVTCTSFPQMVCLPTHVPGCACACARVCRMDDWRWFGTAGHFVCASQCCFRLHTRVGDRRISTVGCYHPVGEPDAEPREVGCGRLYETMVFVLGEDGEPVDWAECDSDAYNDPASAEAGHLAMCRKYS